MNFKKPIARNLFCIMGLIYESEMEQEIKKSPAEYSWEYKKFRRLSQEPKDIYKVLTTPKSGRE